MHSMLGEPAGPRPSDGLYGRYDGHTLQRAELEIELAPILGGTSEAQRAAEAARERRRRTAAAGQAGGGSAAQRQPSAAQPPPPRRSDANDESVHGWVGDDFTRTREGCVRIIGGNMKGRASEPINGAGIIADLHRITCADIFTGTETGVGAGDRAADNLGKALVANKACAHSLVTDAYCGDNYKTGTLITFPTEWNNDCSGGGDPTCTRMRPAWDKCTDAAPGGRACALRIRNVGGTPGVLIISVYAPQRHKGPQVDVLWQWLVRKCRRYLDRKWEILISGDMNSATSRMDNANPNGQRPHDDHLAMRLLNGRDLKGAFTDLFRTRHTDIPGYTFYRSNVGEAATRTRIDAMWATAGLVAACRAVGVGPLMHGSDHRMLAADFAFDQIPHRKAPSFTTVQPDYPKFLHIYAEQSEDADSGTPAIAGALRDAINGLAQVEQIQHPWIPPGTTDPEQAKKCAAISTEDATMHAEELERIATCIQRLQAERRRAGERAHGPTFDLPPTHQQADWRAGRQAAAKSGVDKGEGDRRPDTAHEPPKRGGGAAKPDEKYLDEILRRLMRTIAAGITKTVGTKKRSSETPSCRWRATQGAARRLQRAIHKCATAGVRVATEARAGGCIPTDVADALKEMKDAQTLLAKNVERRQKNDPVDHNFFVEYYAPVLCPDTPDAAQSRTDITAEWCERLASAHVTLGRDILLLNRAAVQRAVRSIRFKSHEHIAAGRTGPITKRVKPMTKRVLPTTTRDPHGTLLRTPKMRRQASSDKLMGERQRWDVGAYRGPLLWQAVRLDGDGTEHYNDATVCQDKPGTSWVGEQGHWAKRGEDERGFPTWTTRAKQDVELANDRDKLVHDMFLNTKGHTAADWEPELQPGETGQRRCMGVLTDAEWEGMLRVRRDKAGKVIPGGSLQTKASGPSGFQAKVIRGLPAPHQRLLRAIIDLSLLQCIPPTSLMQSLVTFIPKPGKGLDILEQRPLQLVELILREVDSIIMARLARGMRLKSLLPECAYGSYPGRSTAQIIAAVTSAMAAAHTTASPQIILCLDLLKAYEATSFFSIELGLKYLRGPGPARRVHPCLRAAHASLAAHA